MKLSRLAFANSDGTTKQGFDNIMNSFIVNLDAIKDTELLNYFILSRLQNNSLYVPPKVAC